MAALAYDQGIISKSKQWHQAAVHENDLVSAKAKTFIAKNFSVQNWGIFFGIKCADTGKLIIRLYPKHNVKNT